MNIVAYTLQSLNADLNKISLSLSRLSTEQVWRRLRQSSNSVGNLCLHLNGAEYQRVTSAIGGQPLVRERTLEFTTEGGFSPEELLIKMQNVRDESTVVLSKLSKDDLNQEIPMYFQSADWKRMLGHRPDFSETPAYKSQKISLILLGMVSHYSYHTGQIVFLTKLLQDSDENILQFKH